jgi:hypothetical protein
VVLCFGDLRGNGHYGGVSTQILDRLTDVRPRFISSAVLPNDLAVDSARNTVLQLEVHLGNGVFREYGCIRDITCPIACQYMVREAGSHSSDIFSPARFCQISKTQCVDKGL